MIRDKQSWSNSSEQFVWYDNERRLSVLLSLEKCAAFASVALLQVWRGRPRPRVLKMAQWRRVEELRGRAAVQGRATATKTFWIAISRLPGNPQFYPLDKIFQLRETATFLGQVRPSNGVPWTLNYDHLSLTNAGGGARAIPATIVLCLTDLVNQIC